MMRGLCTACTAVRSLSMTATRALALMIIAVLIGVMAAAGSADEIDNCCFVDRQCHSDQDWINGYWAFQNKQCAAPAQSQPMASGQTPANVDNCCYVDRQCSSDLDWIGGWHAYQNNLCGAAPQAGAPTSSQPASGVILRTAGGIVMGNPGGRGILPSISPSRLPAPGQSIYTSNCCEEDWQCNNDQDWANGYHGFQNDPSCALPGLITIVGAPPFVDQFERGLDLLRNKLPHRYYFVLDGVDKVEMHEGHGGGVGGYVNALSRTFFVAESGFLDPQHSPSVEQLSTSLVHEACHVHRANAGHIIRNGCDRIREEAFCEGMELEVLIELNVAPSLIERQRDFVASIRSGEFKVSTEGC
ncbi:MAG: hypothetical protein OXE46_09535 [Chloroflexi bacterium]|nr:hypothetical protein [Chloroflexota bacterium]